MMFQDNMFCPRSELCRVGHFDARLIVYVQITHKLWLHNAQSIETNKIYSLRANDELR